jgi:hypothetical protein
MQESTSISARLPDFQHSLPRESTDPELLAFRSAFDGISPLDDLVRYGTLPARQTSPEPGRWRSNNRESATIPPSRRIGFGSLQPHSVLRGIGLVSVFCVGKRRY